MSSWVPQWKQPQISFFFFFWLLNHDFWVNANRHLLKRIHCHSRTSSPLMWGPGHSSSLSLYSPCFTLSLIVISLRLHLSAKLNNLTQNSSSVTQRGTLPVYTPCFLFCWFYTNRVYIHVCICIHTRTRGLARILALKHSAVCVCVRGSAGVCAAAAAAGVSVAEEGDKSQTAFPPAISLGTLRLTICICKETALPDWPWNQQLGRIVCGK